MFNFSYLIEILTPQRSSPNPLEQDMNLFAGRYRRILDSGCGVSIPDNPMGKPRYTAIEAIQFYDLAVVPEKMVMNLNTFHEKAELDAMLEAASGRGVTHLLVVRGDGGPMLPALDPKTIGGTKSVAASTDLLRYIDTAYAGRFVAGAAFNQYNSAAFEMKRRKEKIAAGAKFVVTQPVIGKDPNVDRLYALGIPVVIEAWMSKKVDLLYKSIHRPLKENAEAYDPVRNLRILHQEYPGSCVYLSLLSFKQEWKDILPALPPS
jgi:methylenetetrahydrofolate reductase (NADPH)